MSLTLFITRTAVGVCFMVRCEVCGKEVFTGWICGVVPANDTHKLGLCPEHDTPEHREEVQQKWERLLQDKLRRTLAQERHETRSKEPQSLEVVIHFLGGGVQGVSCKAYDVNQEGDLLVLKEDGALEFYPLQHIRRFVVKESRAKNDDPTHENDREGSGNGRNEDVFERDSDTGAIKRSENHNHSNSQSPKETDSG